MFISPIHNINYRKTQQKSNLIAFGAKYSFLDNGITYDISVDDKDKSIDVKKVINGKVYAANQKLIDFCSMLQKHDLLDKAENIYKKFAHSDLSTKLSGITHKLNIEEIEAYTHLINSPNKKTLAKHLTKDGIIDAIKSKKNDELSVGVIKKLDVQDIEKIKAHIYDLDINSNNGIISGAHNYEIYKQIETRASKNIDTAVDVTDILPNKQKNLKIFAEMCSNIPNALYLSTVTDDELYSMRAEYKSNFIFQNKIIMKKELDENGKASIRYIFNTDVKNNSPTKNFFDDVFNRMKRHLVSINSGCSTITIGKQKHKSRIYMPKKISDNKIIINGEIDNHDTSTVITRKTAPNGKFYYNISASILYPFDYMKNIIIKESNAEKNLNSDIKDFIENITDEQFQEILFHPDFLQNEETEYINSDTLSIKLDDNKMKNTIEEFQSQKNIRYGYNKAIYAIEKIPQPNGLIVLKYAFGLDTAKPVIDNIKTIAPYNITENVLKKISTDDFNAAYTVNNTGKIIAYFKYKDIYFKLILSDASTPTCFPIATDKLKSELGKNFLNIPEISA